MEIYVYDIETFINLLTVTFVNLNDDNDKHVFVIFNDVIGNNNIDDYLKLISFVNKKQYLLGYNSKNYDSILLKYIIMNGYKFNNIKKLLKLTKEFSDTVIYNSNNNLLYSDTTTSQVLRYGVLFKDIDFQKLMALDKSHKSLKQCLINIKYPNILEFELPKISDTDRFLYDDKLNVELDTIKEWDRYILHEWLNDVLVYNLNDVMGLKAMVNTYIAELKSRFDVSIEYGLNVLSSSRADVANSILIHEYSKATGLQYNDFRNKSTIYSSLKLSNYILPFITFETDTFKQLLSNIKSKTIKDTRKELSFEVLFNGSKFHIASGGLHTGDIPQVFKSNDKYIIRDADGTSYYPFLMIHYGISPKHLGKEFFNIFKRIVYARVSAKKEGNKKLAGILKIVINSLFGKLGYEYGWFYDRGALVKVTINGQLLLLKLVEMLYLVGIKTISANTDGIVCLIPRDKEDIYYKTCEQWEILTKINLEYTDYTIYVRENVNTYITVTTNNDIKRKGILNRNRHIEDINKAFNMPIIAIAIEEYFINNTKPIDTLYNHTDIYDFCMSQNIGGKFILELHMLKDNKKHITKLQKANRFYVSTDGGTLIKRSNIMFGGDNSISNIIKGYKVTIFNKYVKKDMKDYNIDYSYYLTEINKRITIIENSLNTHKKKNKTYTNYAVGGLFKDIEF